MYMLYTYTLCLHYVYIIMYTLCIHYIYIIYIYYLYVYVICIHYIYIHYIYTLYIWISTYRHWNLDLSVLLLFLITSLAIKWGNGKSSVHRLCSQSPLVELPNAPESHPLRHGGGWARCPKVQALGQSLGEFCVGWAMVVAIVSHDMWCTPNNFAAMGWYQYCDKEIAGFRMHPICISVHVCWSYKLILRSIEKYFARIAIHHFVHPWPLALPGLPAPHWRGPTFSGQSWWLKLRTAQGGRQQTQLGKPSWSNWSNVWGQLDPICVARDFHASIENLDRVYKKKSLLTNLSGTM